jgi:hypothetical protein
MSAARRRRRPARRGGRGVVAALLTATVVAGTGGIYLVGHPGHDAGPEAAASTSALPGSRAQSSVPGSSGVLRAPSSAGSSGVSTALPSNGSLAEDPTAVAAGTAGSSSAASTARQSTPRSTHPTGGTTAAASLIPSARPTNGVPAPTISPPPVVTHTATPSASPSASASKSVTAAPGTTWRPAVGTTWQWQLSGSIDTSVVASVYDIDAESSAATVAALHAQGRHVICYVDVGSWEPDRADAGKFPASVRGNKMDGWDENWLDIRQIGVLEPLMAARFDTCKAKGFDAIEPDNVDGYANSTGFSLTAADQLAYNRTIAQLAHQRGLGVALKNDLDQTGALVSSFDFAINEQCAEYSECSALSPFVSAGKAVLQVEYNVALTAFCGKYPGFSSMRKHVSLDAWRQAC